MSVALNECTFKTTGRAIFRVGERYVAIEQGSGDNLLDEDIQKGYVDYFNYAIFENIPITRIIDDPDIEGDFDGGMYLTKKSVEDFTAQEIIDTFKDYLSDQLGNVDWSLIYTE